MRRLIGLLLAAFVPLAASMLRGRPADDILHILPPDNIDRLRLDFNASRSKVRLVFMLSPT